MQIVVKVPDDMIKSIEQGSFGAKYNTYDIVGCLMNGTPLPDGAEILTKEAYSDLCRRAADVPDTNVGDLISRKAAIDAFHFWFRDGFDEDKWWNSTHVLAAIEGLPSVHSEHKWETCFECPLSHGCPKVKGCTNEQAIEYASQIPNDCPLYAQPEKRTEKRTETHACDCMSRQAAEEKLKKVVDEMALIFADIREKNVDDSVCGLCEYDCDHGIDGYANECPGFERDDCFKLKEEYQKEWTDLSDIPSVEPERKSGKWIRAIDPDVNAWTGGHACSECGRACVQMSMNFCANCGAPMEVDR